MPRHYEVTESIKVLLDSNEEIPLPLLAKLLKFKLLWIKSNDQKRREQERKVNIVLNINSLWKYIYIFCDSVKFSNKTCRVEKNVQNRVRSILSFAHFHCQLENLPHPDLCSIIVYLLLHSDYRNKSWITEKRSNSQMCISP